MSPISAADKFWLEIWFIREHKIRISKNKTKSFGFNTAFDLHL